MSEKLHSHSAPIESAENYGFDLETILSSSKLGRAALLASTLLTPAAEAAQNLTAPIGFILQSDLQAQGLVQYDENNGAHFENPNTWFQNLYADNECKNFIGMVDTDSNIVISDENFQLSAAKQIYSQIVANPLGKGNRIREEKLSNCAAGEIKSG